MSSDYLESSPEGAEEEVKEKSFREQLEDLNRELTDPKTERITQEPQSSIRYLVRFCLRLEKGEQVVSTGVEKGIVKESLEVIKKIITSGDSPVDVELLRSIEGRILEGSAPNERERKREEDVLSVENPDGFDARPFEEAIQYFADLYSQARMDQIIERERYEAFQAFLRAFLRLKSGELSSHELLSSSFEVILKKVERGLELIDDRRLSIPFDVSVLKEPYKEMMRIQSL